MVGPIARTVEDAALLLDMLAGYTPEGSYASFLSETALEGARVGTCGPGRRAEPLSGGAGTPGRRPALGGGAAGLARGRAARARRLARGPTAAPDPAELRALREVYLQAFGAVMEAHDLDILILSPSSAALPGIFAKEPLPDTTISEINIAGAPGVTVPAGRHANGAPSSLILVGPLWSEAQLLACACDYEQATRHRIVPALVAEPYEEATAAERRRARSASLRPPPVPPAGPDRRRGVRRPLRQVPAGGSGFPAFPRGAGPP